MQKKITFEDGLAELESIARSLESGSTPLEESFAAFERAMKLKTDLEKMLDDGDRKIRILTASGEKEINAEDL